MLDFWCCPMWVNKWQSFCMCSIIETVNMLDPANCKVSFPVLVAEYHRPSLVGTGVSESSSEHGVACFINRHLHFETWHAGHPFFLYQISFPQRQVKQASPPFAVPLRPWLNWFQSKVLLPSLVILLSLSWQTKTSVRPPYIRGSRPQSKYNMLHRVFWSTLTWPMPPTSCWTGWSAPIAPSPNRAHLEHSSNTPNFPNLGSNLACLEGCLPTLPQLTRFAL